MYATLEQPGMMTLVFDSRTPEEICEDANILALKHLGMLADLLDRAFEASGIGHGQHTLIYSEDSSKQNEHVPHTYKNEDTIVKQECRTCTGKRKTTTSEPNM